MRPRLTGSSLAALLAATAAQAEAPEKDHAASGLAELIVTAQRRPEALQEVPLSVSVISGDRTRAEGLRTLEDLSAWAPGLVATGDVGYGAAPLAIRGVGGANGGANFFADEPVAVYVDGAYIGRLSVSTADLVDVDALQVIRGPQGTLFGRNATAGAVLVTSRRPTPRPDGVLNARWDSLGAFKAEAAFGGPLAGDGLQARLALGHAHRDGFGRNVITGRKVGGGDDTTARLTLRLTPGERSRFDLIGEYRRQDAEVALIRIAALTGGPADSPFVPRPDLGRVLDRGQYAFDTPGDLRSETKAATLLGEHRLGRMTLSTVSNYRRFSLGGSGDADNTAPADRTGGPVEAYNTVRLTHEQWLQEVRLASPPDARIAWVAGAFHMRERNKVHPSIIQNAGAFFRLGTRATFDAGQTVRAGAVFADASVRATDRLTLRGGARLSREEKVFSLTQTVLTLAGGFAPPAGKVVPAGFAVAAPPTFQATRQFDDVSLRAVLDYRFAPGALAYLNFSQGFKSGGFNVYGLNRGFDPEEIDALEGGLKVELLDRRLRINAAAFRYHYENLQVRLPVTSGGIDIRNVASARTHGAEAEIAVFGDGFQLDASLAWLDARFTDGVLPAVPGSARFAYGASIPLIQEAIDGARLSRAPRWQGAITAEAWRQAGAGWRLAAAASLRLQSNVFYLETNQDQPTYQSGDWSELNARLSLSPPGGRIVLTLFGENLLDDRHVTAATALAGYPQGAINAPRRIGLRATWRP
ncbi:TonB-dependent receptor [Phenylobacterium deserti]|uniref:TonB-dependent receptor n=1 Tax=Phenylobacterium deserti TaxID=1914756 RepID=A0A328AIP3_9CAUL|nr:TonB-dependent receptor [Phenylobacterium deserti]RAK52718.1 hypothetical protein DJ018_11030 [Phenylobacterium deserti]